MKGRNDNDFFFFFTFGNLCATSFYSFYNSFQWLSRQLSTVMVLEGVSVKMQIRL
jgi:hypothetical protein